MDKCKLVVVSKEDMEVIRAVFRGAKVWLDDRYAVEARLREQLDEVERRIVEPFEREGKGKVA